MVIVPEEPDNNRLYAAAPTVSVGVVKAPLNVMFALLDEEVITTLVPVLTAPEKVAPPELVIVIVFSVTEPPTALPTEMVPLLPELSVSDSVFALVPLIVLLKEILLPDDAAAVDASAIDVPKVTAPVKVCVPEVVTLLFKTMLLDAKVKLPEVNSSVSVIALPLPVDFLMVIGSVNV